MNQAFVITMMTNTNWIERSKHMHKTRLFCAAHGGASCIMNCDMVA